MSSFSIGDTQIEPGERKRFHLQIARLPTDNWVSMPVEVIYGRKPGPTIWLSGAIHGDEVLGVEIIRRVLTQIDVGKLSGCVIAVPIVNVFGFVEQSRALPDRRDLNRSFPGSPTGSLASRLANKLVTEIVSHCQYGIDLHTGSNHRENLPQIRANLSDAETRRCALAFGAPVIINSKQRDGSLRQAAMARGIHCLLYEAGEVMRFNREAIEIGVDGVMAVLACLTMYRTRQKKRKTPSMFCGKSTWVRARKGGILRMHVRLGDRLSRGEIVGEVSDAFGADVAKITSKTDGVVIGITNNPLVYQGDAIVHVAQCDPEWNQPGPRDPNPQRPE